MAMAPTQRRTLGVAAALLGIILSVAAYLLATAQADEGSGASDFGAAPATATPAEPAQPAASTTWRPERGEPSRDSTFPAPAPPRELSIPGLGVRAPVDPVGVAADGRMQIPADPDRVGWYRFSPAPGAARGSAIIVGHVDAKGRGLGVLFGLNQVKPGDRVDVRREDGTSVHYEIITRRTVGKNDLAESAVFDREGPAVLTLITCAGPYLPDRGGYQNNLVVTAVEVTK
ncbi:class F sortase [Streptomyces sp. NPDC093089]|uniref:class F sortase n=1 Tax=Streptomyces sp. NPDC093089 TaxID=3366024 RepID=UPI003829FAB7